MPAPDNGVPDELVGPLQFEAGPDAAGMRLDQWLTQMLAGDFSRSRLQSLIRGGFVAITGSPAVDPGRKLKAGEMVELDLPEAEPPQPRGEDIPLDILYEDSELLVVNKPAGMVVHPGAGNTTKTLVNALIHHCGDSLSGIGGVKRPGIVHRLDKDTSGVMVVAKTDRAHRSLSEAFADHGLSGNLKRAYVALVWGAPENAGGVIDAPLGRAADRVRRSVVPAGRADARRAVTHYRVRERFVMSSEGNERSKKPPHAVAALIECRLETGRTHQIRVHMAHISHPVVGDPDYAQAFRTKANLLPEPQRTIAKEFPRQALHAELLAFTHPVSGETMRFQAPFPPDMAALVDGFRKL